jgi:hypothetical protein
MSEIVFYDETTKTMTRVSVQNALPITGSISTSATYSSSPFAFQQTTATTVGGAALASNAATQGVLIKALASNTGSYVYVGPAGLTAATGFPLAPGESISFPVSNSNLIFMLGLNTSDVVAVTGG